MIKKEFITLLKTLKEEDWQRKVNDKWTVKDVVCHMVAWEKGDVSIIRNVWLTKDPPWFYKTNDFDEFNDKAIRKYRSYSPARLIKEWERCQKDVEDEMNLIGKAKLKSRPDLFGWLFEDKARINRKNLSHYEHHYLQIKGVLKK